MTCATKIFLKQTLLCTAFGVWGAVVSITSFKYLEGRFPRHHFREDTEKEEANGRFLSPSVIWGTEYDREADDFDFGNVQAVVVEEEDGRFRPAEYGELFKAAEPTLPRGYDGEVEVNGVGVFTVTNGMIVGNAAYFDNGGWYTPIGHKEDENKSSETP